MTSKEAKVKQRKGHRAYVKRTMNAAMNLVRDFHYAEQSRLLSFRQSLVEKLDVLNGLDKEILGDMTKEGDFELKKWTTICASLLKKINEFESLYFENSPEVEGENKVLGVTWNNFEDNLLFSLKDVIESELNNDIVTKRIVLKTVSSIYDPLGLLSPAVICFKLMFQEVCSLKCNCDFPLADEFKVRWHKLLLSLLNLDVILIPRHYLLHNDLTEIMDIEVHPFSDASIKAYAAVVYLRVTPSNIGIFTNVVCSKTKVAPLKKNNLTIPRLELMACYLLSELLKSVLDSLQSVYSCLKLFCWTDSMDCLHWINSSNKVYEEKIQQNK